MCGTVCVAVIFFCVTKGVSFWDFSFLISDEILIEKKTLKTIFRFTVLQFTVFFF